jgi:hypothetical protein
MAPAVKHPDHDYVVARHERYVEAYHSGSAERMMEFLEKDEFRYSNFGQQFRLKPCILLPFISQFKDSLAYHLHRRPTERHISYNRQRPIRAHIFELT